MAWYYLFKIIRLSSPKGHLGKHFEKSKLKDLWMVGKEHWGFPSCGILPCIRTSQTAAPGMFAESKTDINSGIFHLNTFLLSAHISSTVCNVDGMGSCIFWHLRNEPKCFQGCMWFPSFIPSHPHHSYLEEIRTGSLPICSQMFCLSGSVFDLRSSSPQEAEQMQRLVGSYCCLVLSNCGKTWQWLGRNTEGLLGLAQVWSK